MRQTYVLILWLAALLAVSVYLARQSLPQQQLTEFKQIYDPYESREFVYFAAIAGCNLSSIQSWTCGELCEKHPRFTDISAFYNESHHAQGYVGYEPGRNLIVVSVRHTVDNVNILADLRFWKRKYSACSGCLVEDGFYRVYEDVRENILNQVKLLSQKYPTAKVLLSAHSLGAAVVTLASLDVLQIAPVFELQTLGCPRVGNAAFAQYLNTRLAESTVWRIVNYHDPFPHLPLQSMNFQQYNYEVWFNTPNFADITKYDVCTLTEEPFCSDSVSIFQYNPIDHDTYLGVYLNSQC